MNLSEPLPGLTLPREYNAATDLIERNIRDGRQGKVAIRGAWGSE